MYVTALNYILWLSNLLAVDYLLRVSNSILSELEADFFFKDLSQEWLHLPSHLFSIKKIYDFLHRSTDIEYVQ